MVNKGWSLQAVVNKGWSLKAVVNKEWSLKAAVNKGWSFKAVVNVKLGRAAVRFHEGGVSVCGCTPHF